LAQSYSNHAGAVYPDRKMKIKSKMVLMHLWNVAPPRIRGDLPGITPLIFDHTSAITIGHVRRLLE